MCIWYLEKKLDKINIVMFVGHVGFISNEGKGLQITLKFSGKISNHDRFSY